MSDTELGPSETPEEPKADEEVKQRPEGILLNDPNRAAPKGILLNDTHRTGRFH